MLLLVENLLAGDQVNTLEQKLMKWTITNTLLGGRKALKTANGGDVVFTDKKGKTIKVKTKADQKRSMLLR